MGYYQNQSYYDELVIEGIKKPGNEQLSDIDMFNNDSITLIMDKLFIGTNEDKLTNEENISILCIVVDWGDGKKDTLSPQNFSKKHALGSLADEWKNISHYYHLNTEVEKLTITITVYNTMNEKLVITLTVNIKFKSLAETRAKFELISANITNDNKVSYVINDATSKQMIVVNSVQSDWTEFKTFLDKKTALYNDLNYNR